MTDRKRKIVNDPVYGFITLDDPLILKIIEHPYYQRLRRIHQMAFAHLVYPGAVHTRLMMKLKAFNHKSYFFKIRVMMYKPLRMDLMPLIISKTKTIL